MELSENEVNETIYKTILKNKNIAYHIDFKNVTPKTLKEFISKLKTGVIILMKKRYYTSLIYIRDETKIINVNEFYTILEKDLSNLIQLNKYLIENKLGTIDVKEVEDEQQIETNNQVGNEQVETETDNQDDNQKVNEQNKTVKNSKPNANSSVKPNEKSKPKPKTKRAKKITK